MVAHSLINIKKYNMHICTFKIDNVWLYKNKKNNKKINKKIENNIKNIYILCKYMCI